MAEKKHEWMFVNMFLMPKIESYLEQQAQQGWVFQEVHFWYRFDFIKMKPEHIAYTFDYRGYLLEDYMKENSRKGWTTTKVSKFWSIMAKRYSGTRPVFKNDYDPDIIKMVSHTITVQFILILMTIVLPIIFFPIIFHYWHLMALYYLINIWMAYSLLRLMYYRAMVQARDEIGAKQ